MLACVLFCTAVLGGGRALPLDVFKIVDFRPTTFEARAEEAFFYSIGSALKYGLEIDPASPTLVEGFIRRVVVAPDNSKAAVVVDGVLTIVSGDGATHKRVAEVRSTYFQDSEPVGVTFTQDDHYQWSRDSAILYLTRYEYFEHSSGDVRYRGELWAYEPETDGWAVVLCPFMSDDFFFDAKGDLYFSESDGTGHLVLMHFDGQRVRRKSAAADGTIDVESPFGAFRSDEYQGTLSTRGVQIHSRSYPENVPEELTIRSKPLLRVSQEETHFILDFKEPHGWLLSSMGVFLPGDRYFLLNLFCDNFSGELLIDADTGDYMTLPTDTRVYPRFDTSSYPHYQVTGEGLRVAKGPFLHTIGKGR